MKINLEGGEFDEWGYDRDNGAGTAKSIIDILRSTGETNSIAGQVQHEDGKHKAADIVREHLPGETTLDESSGIPSIHLGLSEFADVLGPAIEKATNSDSE